jgi:hypothetical protein
VLPVKTADESGPVAINAATDKESPFTKVLKIDDLPVGLNEYGYGFWMRFLTTYPTRLWAGKNAPWYFVARLTINESFGDAGFGDRLLAIW